MLYANGKPVGGGTGGHTIIDENGNSMTARAGLQFVGGANVSDDATNNKTIVDLASAGGIDGVFIDTSNLITSGTLSNSGTTSYTATEDCYFVGYSSSGSALAYLIDNVTMIFAPTNQTHSLLLKKGQTLTVGEASTYSISYKIYGIQTGTTHSKFQPVIYSTEEREIGVWTDGKPLYSKVVEIQSFSSSSPISIDVSSLNVDTMVDVVGEAYAISNNVITEVLYFPIYKFANIYTAQIRYSNNAIQIYHENLNEYTSGIVKILYTKTTDVAGSGTWTPQGVPAEHYSLDEQIIGTWIDGSTLYEKTLAIPSLSAGSNTIQHNIANFDKMISCQGRINYDGDDLVVPYMQTQVINGYVSYGIGISNFNSTRYFIILGNMFDVSKFSGGYVTVRYTKSS